MSKQQEALRLALEALEFNCISSEDGEDLTPSKTKKAITAIREALAEQPAQQRTDYAVHLHHCNMGEWEGACKYSDPDCPALAHAELRAKLKPAQQEPVAWLFTNVQSGYIEASTDPYDKQGEREYWHPAPLYTSPPASKPLTDEEINKFFLGMEPNNGFWLSFARAIEAAHGIKGDA